MKKIARPFVVSISAMLLTTIILSSAIATSGQFDLLFAAQNFVVGQLPGTKTNDNANAGNVGEFVSSTANIGLTSTVAANVTSISLTAGDWDVWGTTGINGGATATVNWLQMSVTATSAAISGTIGQTAGLPFFNNAFFSSTSAYINVPPVRFSLNATTTIYCVNQASFAVSSVTAYCNLSARRVR